MKARLLNGTQLAEQMGKNPGFVSVMKKSGYVFQYGTQTTLAHALAWRKLNPNFRTTSYYRAHRRLPGDEKAATAGKSGELAHSNGQ